MTYIKMSRKTGNVQSRATFFRYSAVLSLTAVLLRKLPNINLRWLNRVMQGHEARASDFNRKLIFSFFLLFS